MTTPPFELRCGPCDGRKVWHSDWPDVDKIKEAWEAHERRTHEADVCADLFMDPRVGRAR